MISNQITTSIAVFAGMAFGTLAGLPASPFYAAAGALWGAKGLPIAALAMAVHILGGWALSKGLLKPLIEKAINKFEEKLKEVSASGIGPAKITLLIRLLPAVPLCVKTYALSMMELPFFPYFLISLVIETLWAGGYMLAGESVMKGQWVMFATAFALIIILTLIAKNYVRRKTSR